MAELLPGAQTAVRTCMNVTPGERVLILTDKATRLVGAALSRAAQEAGAEVTLYELEDFAERPIHAVPSSLERVILRSRPDVTFYAATSQPGEISFRMQLRPLFAASNPKGIRHGHMIGITPALMTQGMRVDYQRIFEVTMRITDVVTQAKTIRVTSPNGTDLIAAFDPALQWVPCHGLYHEPGMWGNLPEGEVFTCPASCQGILVADELGDYFSEQYGVLKTPVTFVLNNGRVQSVQCENKYLQREVENYVFGAKNADRAGEFAIGTNIALTTLVGNLLQDEKFPGVHVAFGDPYPQATGANWSSTRHMDVIPRQCTIEVDGQRIMTNGVFEKDILPPSPTE